MTKKQHENVTGNHNQTQVNRLSKNKSPSELWLENNKQAVESCNKLVEKNGLFSDKFRKIYY